MARKNRPDGSKNWAGKHIAELRKQRGLSQHALAIRLQAAGVDIAKNAIQQLEHGHRYIRDMELFMIAKVLGVHWEELFSDPPCDIELQ